MGGVVQGEQRACSGNFHLGPNIVAQLDFPARDPINNYDRRMQHPLTQQDSILHTGTCFVFGKQGIIRQA